MLEDTRLKIFMAVADEGSFTRAAYLLGITQPAVSQNIAELERLTGRTLFERGKGAASLTPDGERFRVHAERILREHAALDTSFSMSDLPAVTLAATPYLLHTCVPSLLKRLSSRLPMRFRILTVPEPAPGSVDADITLYTAPCHEALDFESISFETVRAVCLAAEPDVSLLSAPLLLWTPYRSYCDPSVLGRVVMEADDPVLLLDRLRETAEAVALLPSIPEESGFQTLPAPPFLPVFDIRCKMNEAFTRTEPGKRFKEFLSL